MGLFGKSFEEKVHDAVETVRGKFPQARVAADVNDKVVTLRGDAPDASTKTAIMTVFNSLVDTENTINQISTPQPVAAQPAAAAPRPAAPAAATPGITTAAEPAIRIHEVARGDTLSAISQKYYGSANNYMKIFNANRDILSDPDRIQPGQRLKIPT